jgi:hypothetical protein
MTAVRPLPDDLTLAHGSHLTPEQGMCVMEAVSYVAGEPFSDSPACVSPVIAAFLRSWNDGLPDDATRTRLLAPLIPRVIGTRTTDADEETRAWLATDWLVRVQTPAWLRLAGLEDHARALESLARIADATLARAAQPTIERASAAAWDAAWAAASAAAWDAAWDAARAAAWAAASAAAWDAAWAAARAAASAAAWDAARAAARDAITPTVERLQGEALVLVEAMIAVGQTAKHGGGE